MSRLNPRSASEGPGWVISGTLTSAPGQVQASETANGAEYFDQFLPKGGSCGQATPSSIPERAGPAPLPPYLGSLRKQRELWFLRNCAVAFATRLLEAQTSQVWRRR